MKLRQTSHALPQVTAQMLLCPELLKPWVGCSPGERELAAEKPGELNSGSLSEFAKPGRSAAILVSTHQDSN